MDFKCVFIAFFLAMLTGAAAIRSTQAALPQPSSFSGQVQVYSEYVPDGTIVRAYINGKAFVEAPTHTYEGASIYALTIPADDTSTPDLVEGGQDGDVVNFEVEGIIADESGIWQSGASQALDLSVVPFYAQATLQPTLQPTTQPTSLPTTMPTSLPIVEATSLLTTQPTQTPHPTQKAVVTGVSTSQTVTALQAATTLSVQPGLTLTSPSGGPTANADLTEAATASSPYTLSFPKVAQSGAIPPTQQPTPLVESTQLTASSDDLPVQAAYPSGIEASPVPGLLTPELLLITVIVLIMLGGAVWLLFRRNH